MCHVTRPPWVKLNKSQYKSNPQLLDMSFKLIPNEAKPYNADLKGY